MTDWTDQDIHSLRERLAYDPDTGIFTWLAMGGDDRITKGRNTQFAGKVAFTRDHVKGYRRGVLNGKTLYAHRLAFAFMVGRWPNGEIDHINRDRADNRWCNLRECTRAENAHNMGGWSKSGFKGVSTIRNRWRAQIRRDGCLIHLGCYATPQEAAQAYDAAAIKLDGEFACLNSPAEGQVA